MIHIVTALPCEARPILDYYDLAPLQQGGHFRVYGDEDYTLIISGIGKLAAAAACGYLGALQASQHGAWLNIGIAGHRDYAVGDAYLAHRITDQASQQHWYPSVIFDPPCPTEHLISVDTAETGYALPALYEMEAAGFYNSAIRFAPSELVHCYKVISDNASSPADRVSPQQVETLIQDKILQITSIITTLQQLSNEHNAIHQDPYQYQHLIEKHHFTVTKKTELKQLLRRWSVLSNQSDLPDEIQHAPASLRGNNVLKRLQDATTALPALL